MGNKDTKASDVTAQRDTVRPEARFTTEEGLKRFRAEEPRDARVVLLGDSITERWRRDGADAWRASDLSRMRIANAGVGGDRTQHLLWRLDHGLLAGMRPEVVLVLIGTNNLYANTPEEIAEGVKAVVSRLRRIVPRAKLVLCAVPPWNPQSDLDITASGKVAPLNALIQSFAAAQQLQWWDWAAEFRNEGGLAKEGLFKDRVHLSAAGYQQWSGPLIGLLKSLSI